MAVKRRGIFDIFRDALEDVAEAQSKTAAGKKAPPKSSGAGSRSGAGKTVFPGLDKPIIGQAPLPPEKVERAQTRRVQRRERQRTDREKRFERSVRTADAGIGDHQHNKEVIEEFIRRHEARMDQLRSSYEDDLAKLNRRYEERAQRTATSHSQTLQKMIDRANDGRRLVLKGVNDGTATSRRRA